MGKAKVIMSRIKRRYIKVIAIAGTAVGIFAVVSYVSITSHTKASESKPAFEWYYEDAYTDKDSEYDSTKDENGQSLSGENIGVDMEGEIDFTNASLDTNPDSNTVLVNKELPLPEDYVPSDLVVPNVLYNFNYFDEKKQMRKEAAKALEELFLAASNEGLELYAISGYRSYKRQYEIFTNNVKKRGLDHTTKYSAVPGYSEHQTGLAMDVSTKAMKYRLEASFANTSEGIWLRENCHRFGYIIRYPEGKSEITGYSYEPWHIRYVGISLATYLYEKNLTLEEYYNFTPSMSYKDIISYDNLTEYGIDLEDVIPTKVPTMTPTPTITPEPEEEFEDSEEGDDKEEDTGDKEEDKDKGDKEEDKDKEDIEGEDKEDGKEEENEKEEDKVTPTPTPKPSTPSVTPEPTITDTPTEDNTKPSVSPTPTMDPNVPEASPSVTPELTPTP